MEYSIAKKRNTVDWSVIAALVLLAIYSCITLYSTTHGKTGASVPSHIVEKQILFEVVGFIGMGIAAKFDYRLLAKWSRWLYALAVFLLLVVFAMPYRFGAHSWIPLGLFTLQPSEFAKLALIIAEAAYMAKIDALGDASVGSWKKFGIIIGLVLPPFGLTLIEPALGQAIVLFATVFIMVMVFSKRWQFVVIVLLLFTVVLGVTMLAMNYPAQTTAFINNVLVKHHLIKSFEADRIIVWLNPNFQPMGAGYNVRLAQIAIGSGGVFGEGLLQGVLTSAGSIPNQWNDFIFTAVGEQFGFVGSTVLIVTFLVLFYRLSRIAAQSVDPFGAYVVMGVMGMFGFQVFESIGMNMYLSPATGITLPFMSYGGSALLIDYVAVGVALQVFARSRQTYFTSSEITFESPGIRALFRG